MHIQQRWICLHPAALDLCTFSGAGSPQNQQRLVFKKLASSQHQTTFAISQRLLNQLGPNVNINFQGSSFGRCHISARHLSRQHFFLNTFVHTSNIYSVPDQMLPTFLDPERIFLTTILLHPKVFSTKIFWEPISIWAQFFLPKTF